MNDFLRKDCTTAEKTVEQTESDDKNEELSPFKVITTLFIVALLTGLFSHFVAQRTVVVGESMENTLHDGENLVSDRLTYRFRDPQRFEIVIVPIEAEGNQYIIKRVIGLPNEHIRIDDNGVIYINGSPLEEHYGKETILPENTGLAGGEGITLGEDEYFLMGDNRNHSYDSRGLGGISRNLIEGRVVFRLFKNNGKIE